MEFKRVTLKFKKTVTKEELERIGIFGEDTIMKDSIREAYLCRDVPKSYTYTVFIEKGWKHPLDRQKTDTGGVHKEMGVKEGWWIKEGWITVITKVKPISKKVIFSTIATLEEEI